MTPKQRYQFDVTGYLHLENVLSAEELAAAREAAFRYINTPTEELPPGFRSNGKGFENGFAFDKALEALTVHPATWPIIKELTNNKPQLMRGTMMADRAGVSESEAPLYLHCAREDFGWESTRYLVKDDRIFCNDFVIFPYLTDVYPGDGGLLVVPGSHKAEFPRPETLFNHGVVEDKDSLPPGVVNITPKAGDMVIISELLTHGALPWKPKDRYRCFLVLRYGPQYRGESRVSQEVRARLSPETLELIAREHYTHTKEIIKMDVITLTT
jgi:ectoine hydroxylase-related dioxygenase (phytanoyl-CoA dioxygenase family)